MSQRARVLGLVTALLCSALGFGGSAAFSLDGQSVYLANGKVFHVDLKSAAASPVDVAGMGGPAESQAIAVSNSGYLLCLNAKGAWACNLQKRKAAHIFTTPAGAIPYDIAYDPATSTTCITTDAGSSEFPRIYLLTPKGDAPVEVRTRRASITSGMSFDGKGDLYFGFHGDLWYGSISADEDQYSLTGSRYAPLSTPETYNGTAAGIGVSALAATPNYVYAHLHRMGGSGWGSVVRVPNLAAEMKSTTDTQEGSILTEARNYCRVMSFIEALGDNGGDAYLCGSRDGRRVFYAVKVPSAAGDSDQSHFYLVDDDKKPRELNLTGLK